MLSIPHAKLNVGNNRFNTLKEIKERFGITKLVKTERTGCACSSRGKRHEWPIYEAEISNEFIIK